ncbi:MAG: hypothetical protein C4519_12795 [Desulfobacteraceae bacterium]|nr:MAG: hypothetical protein C4519_12795 [Desulfobacteraceae bacterium]
MFRTKITALAAVGALLIAGCAGPAWVQPSGHPADPAAQEGTRTPITAFERYRGAVKASTPAAPPADGPESRPGMDHHQHHGSQEEMKP